MEEENKMSMKPQVSRSENKSISFQTKPKGEDVAFLETALVATGKEEAMQATEEDIKEAVVYSNDVTSIDFMMPEQEREILEKNLNIYSDLEKTQKILAKAKKNKKLSEDIKSLELIDKAGKFSNQMFDIMTDEKCVEAVMKSYREKIEKGETGKAMKELAMANKIMLDARDQMIRNLNAGNGKKSARIALKFTNENGEFELGADI